MNNNSNYRSIFMDNIILITLCFFVILYVVYNYNEIRMNRFTNNNVNKCLLITSILILLLYLICTWDDEENIVIEDSIKIPKYKLSNEINNKYKLVNDNNVNKKYKLSNDSLNSKLSNQNIFISHKNKNKYGLAF
jgi:hypothetical protein